MSIIISHHMGLGKQAFYIRAQDNSVFIDDTTIENTVIDITGEAEKPFITRSRFRGCTIRAENMRAFVDCVFEDSCEMVVRDFPKNMPSKSYAKTINNNLVGIKLVNTDETRDAG